MFESFHEKSIENLSFLLRQTFAENQSWEIGKIEPFQRWCGFWCHCGNGIKSGLRIAFKIVFSCQTLKICMLHYFVDETSSVNFLTGFGSTGNYHGKFPVTNSVIKIPKCKSAFTSKLEKFNRNFFEKHWMVRIIWKVIKQILCFLFFLYF